MKNLRPVRIKELVNITGIIKENVSRSFTGIDDENLIKKVQNRTIGVWPKAVEKFLDDKGKNIFRKTSIILTANLCGGTAKTTNVANVGAALRRISTSPIVFIDCDSQGSLSQQVTGNVADDDSYILVDYIDKKAELKDIIEAVDGLENTFIIPSNLGNAYLDKSLSKASDVKKSMHRLFTDIIKTFGEETKIIVDFPPQLSGVFASSIVALSEMDKSYLKKLLIPLRSDSFSVNGGSKILQEVEDILETFNLPENGIEIHAYFSNVDNRIKSTATAYKIAFEDEKVSKHLCPVYISNSSEIVNASIKNSTVFEELKGKSYLEFQDLVNLIFSQDKEELH